MPSNFSFRAAPLLVICALALTSAAWSQDADATAPQGGAAAEPAPAAVAAPATSTQPAPGAAVPPAHLTSLEKAGRIGTDSLKPFGLLTELSLLDSGHDGGHRAVRGFEAEVTVGLLTEAIKHVAHEKRPDGSDYKSFPSGHASAAFSAATLLDAYRPRYKAVGYLWATGISLSRVAVHRHYLHDVAVGALLGHYVTRAFTHRYRDGQSSMGVSGQTTSVPAASSASSQLALVAPAAYADARWHASLSGAGLRFGRSF